MNTSKKILIIGSTGFLGSCLLNLLQCDGLAIDTVGRNIFDLSKPISNSFKMLLEKKEYSYVIICAAITDVESCFQQQELSHQVNVTGTQELLNQIAKYKIIPMFFSSDYVFSGQIYPYREEDQRQPNTIYGHQKLSVEQYIENNFAEYMIFRTSKLMAKVPHPKNILFPIIQALIEEKSINCFEDQWLNPIFVEDIANIVKLAIHKKIQGVFHLGTKRIFSRAELGKFLAFSLGYNPNFIQPIKMSDVHFSEVRPTHNILDCTKITEQLNFQCCEIENAITEIKNGNLTL